MKTLALLVLLSACGGHLDNIGLQCQDTTLPCVSDQDCTNNGVSLVCGQNGVCTYCSSSSDASLPPVPDAAPPVDTSLPPVDGPISCVAPPTPVPCTLNTPDCAAYPGTTCEPNNGVMQCMCACTPPSPLVLCQTAAECAPYPNTACLNNVCACL